MKKILLGLCLIVVFVINAQAQRYAIVDSKYILDKVPDYKEAQKLLDKASEGWQKEIDAKQAELDRMYRNYEAEQVMHEGKRTPGSSKTTVWF